MFQSTTYISRRKKLLQDVKGGIILLMGNEESSMNYEANTFHYRQDSSFLYFFGLDFPGLTGVIDVDSGDEYIFGDELTVEDIVWRGTQPSLASRALNVGINKCVPDRKLAEYLNKAKQQNRTVHILPPYRPENKIKLFKLLNIPFDQMQQAASVELIKAVVNQRNYKTSEEIIEIERAVDITADMHIAAMKMARPGMLEAELTSIVNQIAERENGHVSFPTILTTNGQTLHNTYHGNILKKGDLVLCDAGAEITSRYCGDLSSTFPVDSKFTPRQKEIYEICLRAHNKTIEGLKPGVDFKSLYYLSAKMIFEGLKDMGLTKGNAEDAIQSGAHALFFPCGLGHMMGLDIHDMEDLGEVYVGYDGKPKSTQFGLKSLRLARKLEPGFVVTIEPGIYFIPELIDTWKAEGINKEFINFDKVEKYKDFSGLRNEEDFLITDTGYRLLGKPKPKTIEEVEALRANVG